MPHAESPEQQTEKLFVNDGPLAPEQIGTLKPTPIDTPLEEVRRRYEEDGYVYLKGLLPRDDVLKAREEYFKLLSPCGVLAPGSKPVDGIFDQTKDRLDYPGIGAGGVSNNGRPTGPSACAEQFVDLALKAHTEPWYKDVFCKHPTLLDYVAKLTGWASDDTLAVRRTLLRNNTPGNNAIGVHYDQIFLRHGEDSAVTAWVPMGDVSRQGGGLIYLEGSRDLGREIEEDFAKRAKEAGFSDEEAKNAFNSNMISGGMLSNCPAEFARQHGNRKWLLTAYEAGDVVLHHSYMIHASTINYDPENRIRVGTDLRFVNTARPWDKRWNNDFMFNDGV